MHPKFNLTWVRTLNLQIRTAHFMFRDTHPDHSAFRDCLFILHQSVTGVTDGAMRKDRVQKGKNWIGQRDGERGEREILEIGLNRCKEEETYK